MRINRLSLVLSAALLLSACSFPSSGGGEQDAAAQVQTAAASTVSAQLTQSAALVPTATDTPLPTSTQAATETPLVGNTPLPTTSGGDGDGCDSIAFITDVTVPDGTDMAPGATFTKTWRIRNSGSCTWNTSYSVVFNGGNAMGGPATQALAASVTPNSTVDISINMTAPATLGRYTGYWALRNSTGKVFGSFFVIIDVVASGTSVTLTASQVGQVNASGTVGAQPHAGATGGVGVQAFAYFDITSIPNNATITQVTVDFKADTITDPFGAMGCLQGFAGSYFPLDSSDYSPVGSGHDMSWCSYNDLTTASTNNNVKTRLQSALNASANSLEYRFRFNGTPSGDALVRFLNGGFKLIVVYSTP